MVFAEGAQETVDYMTIPGKHKNVWKLEAADGLLIGGYGDNFSYNGKKVVRIGGSADFVYLHGDTGQEAPVMPKVKTYLASWGPVDVFVNGELVYDNLAGHMMYTEGSRDGKTYAIYNKDKSGFFSPMNPSDGSIANPDAKELHFVAHTVGPDKGNFPPHTVWIHLNFQNVKEK